MKRRTTKKKPDFMASAIDIAIMVSGGVAGNYASNFIQKQSFMQGYTQYTPGVTAILGTLVSIFAPDDKLQKIGQGMAVTAGTELAESVMAMAMAPAASAVKGVPATPRAFGYVPQYMPPFLEAGVVRTADGIAVR